MRTLLWMSIALSIYTTPMTVDYTADGYTVLIDNEGGEWEYEEELPGEEVIVMLSNEGTPQIDDDTIIAIYPITEL